MINSKKGGVQDILYIGIFAIVVALALVLCYSFAKIVTGQIYSTVDVPSETKTNANQMVSYYSTYLDGGFIFLIAVLSITTIILAALVRVHPVFIPIYILGLIAVIFVCGIFSNVYEQVSSVPMFASYVTDLSMTNYVISKLPFVVGIIGTILCIAMYKLWSVQR